MILKRSMDFRANRSKNFSSFLVLLVVVLQSFAAGQSINLSGTLLDQLGKPVMGAMVSLAQSGFIDTTDKDGSFNLSENQTQILSYENLLGPASFALKGTKLIYNLSSPSGSLHL